MSHSKNQSVLVTGGAGFIGSELVRQLVAQGHRVKVIDNLRSGKRENISWALDRGAELIIGDIRQADHWKPHLEGVDVLFHLACLGVRHSIHSPLENHEVNAAATLKLLIAAREKGVHRFIYVSSSEVYGSARFVPMNEEHPTVPATVYGASKLAGESYARAFYETYHYPTVIVRPFNTYGPHGHHEGDSGEVIPKFLVRSLAQKPLIIFGSGEQTRDFTYVSDTAAGILKAGFTKEVIGQTINIGQGLETSILALAEKIFEITGSPPNIRFERPRPGDLLRLYADISKAERLLNYRPHVLLKEGLKRLAEWYRGLDESPFELFQEEVAFNWETATHHAQW